MPFLTDVREIAFKHDDGAIYDVYPELAERQPIARWTSDGAGDTGDATGDPRFKSNARYYNTHSDVQKAIVTISNNIASLSVRVMRGETVLDNHPASVLLAEPNPQMDAAKLWREWVSNMSLGGEHGIEVVRNMASNIKKPGAELWNRQPDNFTVKPGPQKARYLDIAAYRLDDGEGKPYELEPSQFIHFKYNNPLSPWRGIAPTTAIRMGIQIDVLAEAWSRLFFDNSARPDMALIAKQGLTQPEKDAIAAAFVQKVGGLANVHKPVVLEDDVTDIKPLGFPPKDIEWLGQRKYSREMIGAMFGIPKEVMGWGENTYENLGKSMVFLWTITLVPIIGLRDATLTHWFRREELIGRDEIIVTDVSGVSHLQADLAAKVDMADVMQRWGVPVTVLNETYGLGLPNYPGDNIGWLPMSLQPSAALPPNTNGKGLAVLQVILDRYRAQLAQPRLMSGFKSEIDDTLPAYGTNDHEALYKQVQESLDSGTGSMQPLVGAEIARQHREVSRKLQGHKGKRHEPSIPAVTDVFDPALEAVLFIAAFEDIIREAVGTYGVDAAAAVEGVFDATRPEVQAAIREVLESFAFKTNNVTHAQLVELFQLAESDGVGLREMQRRLDEYFAGRKSGFQTERIARTTMNAARNAASNIAWNQSGVVAAKIWVSALQPLRSREWHIAAHGQKVKLNEFFVVGGEHLAHPGDPTGSPWNIINCLCSQLPVVEGT